jgi:predicted transcriptional regulator
MQPPNEDPTFDFDAILRQMKIGYADLCTRRTSLRDSIASATTELEKIEPQIEKLSAVLNSMGVTPEESLARPRQMTVSKITEQVVERVFRGDPSSIILEADLITKVKREAPGMLDKSIQSVLYRMSKDGNLTRYGKRGHFSYSMNTNWEEKVALAADMPKAVPAVDGPTPSHEPRYLNGDD